MGKGFRDFVLRGNVVDLAVAVVIGAAFGAIINSLVTNIINPLIAAVVRKPDFSFLTVTIHGGVIKYGDFFNSLISFLIIALVIYYLVVLPVSKLLARFNPPPKAIVATKPCPQCLSDIPLEAKRCSHCTQLVA